MDISGGALSPGTPCTSGDAISCVFYGLSNNWYHMLTGLYVLVAAVVLIVAVMVVWAFRERKRVKRASSGQVSRSGSAFSLSPVSLPVRLLLGTLVISGALGLVVIIYALVNLLSYDLRDYSGESLPNTTASNPEYRDESLVDILPLDPVTGDDIPQLVDLMREARDTQDAAVCKTIPELEDSGFLRDDMILSAPTQAEWARYCQALAQDDRTLCTTIGGYGYPSLEQNCLEVFQLRGSAETS